MVLVCGSRTWTDEGPIREALQDLPADAIVLHNGSPRKAPRVAADLGLAAEKLPPDWPLKRLIEEGLRPSLVLVFGDHRNITEAKARRIPVTTYFG